MNTESDYIKFYTDIFKALLQYEIGIFIILCAIYYIVFGIFFDKKIRNRLYNLKINRELFTYALHGTIIIFFISCLGIWINDDDRIPLFVIIVILLCMELVSRRSEDDSMIFLFVLNNMTVLFSWTLNFVCNALHFKLSLFPTVFFVFLIYIPLIMISDAKFTEWKKSTRDARLIFYIKTSAMFANLSFLLDICSALNF